MSAASAAPEKAGSASFPEGGALRRQRGQAPAPSLTPSRGVGYSEGIRMLPKRLAVAALVLLGIAAAAFEQTLVHTDDGCVVETHCNACLLQLGTSGVATEPFALPRAVPVVERVATALPPTVAEEAPRHVPSRGPPPA